MYLNAARRTTLNAQPRLRLINQAHCAAPAWNGAFKFPAGNHRIHPSLRRWRSALALDWAHQLTPPSPSDDTFAALPSGDRRSQRLQRDLYRLCNRGQKPPVPNQSDQRRRCEHRVSAIGISAASLLQAQHSEGGHRKLPLPGQIVKLDKDATEMDSRANNVGDRGRTALARQQVPRGELLLAIDRRSRHDGAAWIPDNARPPDTAVR